MSFDPRAVDERDTQWEEDNLNLRIFVFRPGGFQDAFDIDRTRLDVAMDWARGQMGSDAFAIALRSQDAQARPGLIWLMGDTANPVRS